MSDFERSIRQLCVDRGMSLSAVCRVMGRPRNHLHRLFRRWPDVPIGEVGILAQALGCRMRLELARNRVTFEVRP